MRSRLAPSTPRLTCRAAIYLDNDLALTCEPSATYGISKPILHAENLPLQNLEVYILV